MQTADTTICDGCGKRCEGAGIGSGYGRTPDGRELCYPCCGAADRERMVADGKATLYLSKVNGGANGFELTNWPGTLRIPVRCSSTGRHNMARTRRDVYFTFEGKEWRGTQYGESSQLCHCRAIKVRA